MKWWVLISLCFFEFILFGQESNTIRYSLQEERSIVFVANPNQQFGLDDETHPKWIDDYENWTDNRFLNYRVPIKSVGIEITDVVSALLLNNANWNLDSLSFRINETNERLKFRSEEAGKLVVNLPKKSKDYFVYAVYKGKNIGKLEVTIYKEIRQKIILVPLLKVQFKIDSLTDFVNEIMDQANLKVDIELEKMFSSADLDSKELFSNPSPNHDRYTEQMKELRDLYLQSNPNYNRKAIYLFVVPGFVNLKTVGYIVRGKSVGFISETNERKLARTIAKNLGFGLGRLKSNWEEEGPEIGTTTNLMDVNDGIFLRSNQWVEIRTSIRTYSFYDDYEDVKTNSGIVAFYFWEEDSKGRIQLINGDFLKTIKRPYKKNQFSYHLNITSFFFSPLFTIRGKSICSLHLFLLISIGFSVYFFGRKWIRFLKTKSNNFRIIRFSSRIFLFFLFVILTWMASILVNRGFHQFEVKGGKIESLGQQSIKLTIRDILKNNNWMNRFEKQVSSELMIHRKEGWYLNKSKRVLYFEVFQNAKKINKTARFLYSSDSLKVPAYDLNIEAESHYLVVDIKNSSGKKVATRVYNHLGIDLSDKYNLENPSKRILLFVNGYRPTSLGHTFEENFSDIQKKGLEFPNSNNMIYLFDRYNYWRPWNGFDLKFAQRINATDVFYADGHHSVSTSNHESLIDFTTLSSSYPKRCLNSKKHVCLTTQSLGFFGQKTVRTASLLPQKSNTSGYKIRFENGKIAGRNLIQLLNEIPNKSKNDTLYVVAHSMGFAYAMGLIEVLRGEIQFGSLYIIAPENAKAGKVNANEWNQIWQYGSNFNPKKSDAPCLLDGVAPQTKVSGLPSKNRVFIPKKYYNRKGFFDSHFIGYYTWLFEIPKNKPGFIIQR